MSVTPIANQIARHWSHPDFRLGGRFPWIAEVDTLLSGNSLGELERKVVDIVWQYVGRLSEPYHFTFEAVVIYLIRWELVYRWTQRDAEVGRQRFDQLVTEAMGEYAQIWQ